MIWLPASLLVLFLLVACSGQPPSAASTTEPVGVRTAHPSPVRTSTLSLKTTESPGLTSTLKVLEGVATLESSHDFSPGPVILPTVAVPIIIPTRVPAGLPNGKALTAIDLSASVVRQLSLKQLVERKIVARKDLAARELAELADNRDKILSREHLYKVLGILDTEDDLYQIYLSLFSERNLGAYYPAEERIYLVKEVPKFGPAEKRRYVHYQVRALQEQHFGVHEIGKTLENNGDESRSFLALVAGDAVLAEFMYVNDHMTERDRGESLEQPSNKLVQAFRAAPHIVQRLYNYPFSEGAFFAYSLYQKDGWEGVNRAYTLRPQSTEHILHPERYLQRELPVKVEIPDIAAALGEGWREIDRDTLGEFMLLAYLETDFSSEEASVATDGWGGDSFTLLQGPQNESLLVISIVWDTNEDAREFYKTFQEFMTTRTEGKWIGVSETVPSTMMTLPDQHIYIELGSARTNVIFAADAWTNQRARGVLESFSGTSIPLITQEEPTRLIIASEAFAPGESIPGIHTCDGDDESPPLEWRGVPSITKSLAIIADVQDVTDSSFVQWIVYDIPPNVQGVKKGVPRVDEMLNGAKHGVNSFGWLEYRGPCPPHGVVHRYSFKVYALDTKLDLEPGATKEELLDAMGGHVLAEGRLTGAYQRSQMRLGVGGK